MRTGPGLLALAVLSLAVLPLPGEESAAPCSSPDHRQFDFWVGEWEVSNALSSAPGPHACSRITSVHGGCAVREEYENLSGYEGSSLSYFDARDGRWHQTWIDNQGAAVLFTGGLEGDSMVLGSQDGENTLGRMTWTPLADGHVRQVWERSEDGGTTWTLLFDGSYARPAAPSD